MNRIPLTDGGLGTSIGRGKTTFRRLTVFPPEGTADVDTVWCRQVAKAMRQVEELCRMRIWGYKADITYSNVRKFANRATGTFAATMQELVSHDMSTEKLQQLRIILEQEYRRAKLEGQRRRLKAWKSRLQSSEKQSYKWIQGHARVEALPMKTSKGYYTVDRTEQFDEILNEWLPIFNKFKTSKPDVATFIEHFGKNLRTSSMSLGPLTGDDLVKAALATKPSSASLDNWQPSAITTLAQWYPMVFNDLALILNWIEEQGKWPVQIMDAYTSLIPKDDTVIDVAPTDFRPITVLSAVYRLYAKARFGSLLQWQEGWVTESVFGCRSGKSAEGMAMEIAMELESTGYTEFQYVAGVSYDCRKAFDLVPIQTAMEILKLRGCHERILKCVQGLYNGMRRAFRLHGALGEWWWGHNGLAQGDPISMIMLNSLVTCVVETTDSLVIQQIRVRSYADDLSAVVRGTDPDSVCNKLRAVHDSTCCGARLCLQWLW